MTFALIQRTARNTLLGLRQPAPGPARLRLVPAPRRPAAPVPEPGLPHATGDFDKLASARKVAVVLDAENLAYSARDLGLRLDFAALARLLRNRFADIELHAVVSVPPDQLDATRADADRTGWTGHPRAIITTPRRRCANGDVSCAFVTAAVLARRRIDTLVIGTGDGPLGLDVARGVRANFPNCRRIATLSVAQSTSNLLRTAHTVELDANLILGRDVLRR